MSATLNGINPTTQGLEFARTSVDEHVYTAILSRGPEEQRTCVDIYVDDMWAGNGWFSAAGRIEDCPAVLDDEVYDELENQIADAFSRGCGSEYDPAATEGQS